MKKIEVRKLSQYVPLTKQQFRDRFFERFYDPAFDALKAELDKVCAVAWNGYIEYRKLDADRALFIEVDNAAKSLARMIGQVRSGKFRPADAGLRDPRQK